MSRLRQLSLWEVPITAELAVAIASLPALESVALWAVRDPPAEAAWPHLAQLGARFKLLDMTAFMTDLPRNAEGIHQMPPGLLACTGLGQLDLCLIPWDAFPSTRLAGLTALPALRSMNTDGGVPREAWTCRGLTCLQTLNNPVAMPSLSLPPSQLAPLRELGLSCWDSGGRPFPEKLCHLSALESLTLSHCRLPPVGALQPQISQLSTMLARLVEDSRDPLPSLEADAALRHLVLESALPFSVRHMSRPPYLP
ncbi:hypothetical protein ABPG75_004122 [Micractinium tetrahymenae]